MLNGRDISQHEEGKKIERPWKHMHSLCQWFLTSPSVSLKCSSSWSSHSSFAVGYFCFQAWWKYSSLSRYSFWICYLNYLPSLSLNIRGLSLPFHVFLLQENFCSIPWTLLLSHWLLSDEIIFFQMRLFSNPVWEYLGTCFQLEAAKISISLTMSYGWEVGSKSAVCQLAGNPSFPFCRCTSDKAFWWCEISSKSSIPPEKLQSSYACFSKTVICSVYQNDISCPDWIKVDFLMRQIVVIHFFTTD